MQNKNEISLHKNRCKTAKKTKFDNSDIKQLFVFTKFSSPNSSSNKNTYLNSQNNNASIININNNNININSTSNNQNQINYYKPDSQEMAKYIDIKYEKRKKKNLNSNNINNLNINISHTNTNLNNTKKSKSKKLPLISEEKIKNMDSIYVEKKQNNDLFISSKDRLQNNLIESINIISINNTNINNNIPSTVVNTNNNTKINLNNTNSNTNMNMNINTNNTNNNTNMNINSNSNINCINSDKSNLALTPNRNSQSNPKIKSKFQSPCTCKKRFFLMKNNIFTNIKTTLNTNNNTNTNINIKSKEKVLSLNFDNNTNNMPLLKQKKSAKNVKENYKNSDNPSINSNSLLFSSCRSNDKNKLLINKLLSSTNIFHYKNYVEEYKDYLNKFIDNKILFNIAKNILYSKVNRNKQSVLQHNNKFINELIKSIYGKIDHLLNENEITNINQAIENIINLLRKKFDELNEQIDKKIELFCKVNDFTSKLINNQNNNVKNLINNPYINEILYQFIDKVGKNNYFHTIDGLYIKDKKKKTKKLILHSSFDKKEIALKNNISFLKDEIKTNNDKYNKTFTYSKENYSKFKQKYFMNKYNDKNYSKNDSCLCNTTSRKKNLNLNLLVGDFLTNRLRKRNIKMNKNSINNIKKPSTRNSHISHSNFSLVSNNRDENSNDLANYNMSNLNSNMNSNMNSCLSNGNTILKTSSKKSCKFMIRPNSKFQKKLDYEKLNTNNINFNGLNGINGFTKYNYEYSDNDSFNIIKINTEKNEIKYNDAHKKLKSNLVSNNTNTNLNLAYNDTKLKRSKITSNIIEESKLNKYKIASIFNSTNTFSLNKSILNKKLKLPSSINHNSLFNSTNTNIKQSKHVKLKNSIKFPINKSLKSNELMRKKIKKFISIKHNNRKYQLNTDLNLDTYENNSNKFKEILKIVNIQKDIEASMYKNSDLSSLTYRIKFQNNFAKYYNMNVKEHNKNKKQIDKLEKNNRDLTNKNHNEILNELNSNNDYQRDEDLCGLSSVNNNQASISGNDNSIYSHNQLMQKAIDEINGNINGKNDGTSNINISESIIESRGKAKKRKNKNYNNGNNSNNSNIYDDEEEEDENDEDDDSSDSDDGHKKKKNKKKYNDDLSDYTRFLLKLQSYNNFNDNKESPNDADKDNKKGEEVKVEEKTEEGKDKVIDKDEKIEEEIQENPEVIESRINNFIFELDNSLDNMKTQQYLGYLKDRNVSYNGNNIFTFEGVGNKNTKNAYDK